MKSNNIGPSNVEPNNKNNTESDKKNNIFQLTNNRSSFIWNYLEKLTPIRKHKKCVKCLIPVISHNGKQPCEYIIGTNGSTGNFIYHLSKHNITCEMLLQNNENVINKAWYMINNPDRKSQLDKKFVRIIVKDNQPLSIWNDKGFWEFVEELDLFYELPNDKKVKELLVKSYNYCKWEISHLFDQGITSCSLTLDL